jgi:type II secretory pathway component GspD/PulD (secretin)
MAASVDLLAVGRKKPPRKVWAVLVLALAATAAVAARYMAQAIQERPAGRVVAVVPASPAVEKNEETPPSESPLPPIDGAFDSGVATAGPPADVGRAAAVEKDRDLRDWLFELAGQAGLGIVVAQGVSGRPAARFPPGISWRAKLDVLADTSGFSYGIDDGLIRVFETAPAPLPPPIDDPRTAEPVSTVAVRRLSNARARDVARVVENSFAGRGLAATADEASNALVLSGATEIIDEGFDLVDSLDVARRRFLLEARIVEMLSATRNELGIQWRLQSGDFAGVVNFPASATEGGDGSEITVATAGTTSLRARLSALEADGKVRVIARPRVLVVEGRPALIESVRILRVRLPDRSAVVTDADEVVAPDAGRAVEEFPVGISLRVEPSLLGGGEVALRIAAKSSTLGEPLPPDDIPEEFSRLVEAELVVADGRTAVLGGLSRVGRSRSGAGVPLLREIPLVGRLFGRRAEERDREELLVLVTPRLLP